MTTIYFDTCALNRLTDAKSQPRIRAEAEAIDHLLALAAEGTLHWVVSRPLRFELSNNPDPVRRAETLALLTGAHSMAEVGSDTEKRAAILQMRGLGPYDALHFAICEQAGVDLLVTVDDRFVRRASRIRTAAKPQVIDPVDWWTRRSTWLLSP